MDVRFIVDVEATVEVAVQEERPAKAAKAVQAGRTPFSVEDGLERAAMEVAADWAVAPAAVRVV